MCLALKNDFAIYRTFDWLSWLWIILASACAIYGETMRFKALKLMKASDLQIYYPVCMLFQFIFDEVIFHIPYTYLQYGALGYLTILYVF